MQTFLYFNGFTGILHPSADLHTMANHDTDVVLFLTTVPVEFDVEAAVRPCSRRVWRRV